MSELKIKYQFSKKKNKKVFLFYLTEFLFLKLFTYPPHVVKFNAMLNLVTVRTLQMYTRARARTCPVPLALRRLGRLKHHRLTMTPHLLTAMKT